MAGRKRKRHVLSLATKLDIIAELEKGISQRVLADKFDVAKSTVSDISRDRVKIKEYVSSAEAPGSFAKKRHIMRRSHFGKLDKAIHMWFIQERSRGAPVSGPLLQENAISLFKLLYQDKDALSIWTCLLFPLTILLRTSLGWTGKSSVTGSTTSLCHG